MKRARYKRISAQLEKLLVVDSLHARMATISALLHHKMHFFWTGFYLLEDGVLTVQTYQGPLACQTLAQHTGACWTAIDKKCSIVIPDIEAFEGHIACDCRSKSEIVIPLFGSDGVPYAVLDIDSDKVNTFDDVDREKLEKIIKMAFTK